MSSIPPATATGNHLVQGMERDLVAADWPTLDDEEVSEVLSQLDGGDDSAAWGGERVDARVTWSSPRPMSAAAMVRNAGSDYFVKRHHVSVRHPDRLRLEHDFARHLRERGQPVPRVLAGPTGDTVVTRSDYLYEVQERTIGIDLYRDHPSWYPFTAPGHARAAGTALARFHVAARDFAAPATPPGVLTNSQIVITSGDPVATLNDLVSARPVLARALAPYDLTNDVRRHLLSHINTAASSLRHVASQWGHGDWHPSNLTWTTTGPRARVASVFDLGLANRTSAVHDLATALERSAIDWLDLGNSGEVRADLVRVDALLDGYESVRPLEREERTALPHVLPVVHLEFALSEVEYFAGVVHSQQNTTLAYESYLMGHAQWFEGPRGSELLGHLHGRWI